eukprot:6888583-Pyramimonas_sp.AAC.1
MRGQQKRATLVECARPRIGDLIVRLPQTTRRKFKLHEQRSESSQGTRTANMCIQSAQGAAHACLEGIL